MTILRDTCALLAVVIFTASVWILIEALGQGGGA